MAQKAGSGESRDKLRAGNYLVATWDALTDGHQYDGVISQIGAYLPHGVSYVKQFVDEKILPENMDRYVVMPGGKVFMTFERGPIIPIATTELGLKEFLDFLERYVRGERNLEVYKVCHSATSCSRSCYYTAYGSYGNPLSNEVWWHDLLQEVTE